jgi:hypothetical protein
MVLLYVPGTWWRNIKYIWKPNTHAEGTRWWFRALIQVLDFVNGMQYSYIIKH